MNLVFLADYFLEQLVGGGEINNDELIKLLIQEGHQLKKVNTQACSLELLKQEQEEGCFFIVSNFVGLNEECKHFLYDKNYIIYEHDHKYLPNRNPALYKYFTAPKEKLVNVEFYKNAKKVFCQSDFHANIVRKNLEFDNITSLGGNLWPVEILEKIREISKEEKEDKYSIMQSPISHKGTDRAIRYCKERGLEYELIPPSGYLEFLERMSRNNAFVFFPATPETLSRVVVEARMMNMRVITNQLVGAAREDWFELRGEPLVDLMLNKRKEILDNIEEVVNER